MTMHQIIPAQYKRLVELGVDELAEYYAQTRISGDPARPLPDRKTARRLASLAAARLDAYARAADQLFGGPYDAYAEAVHMAANEKGIR